ncbi:MAG: phytoene desaturase family protein, partial [Mycobacteriales bacterium]
MTRDRVVVVGAGHNGLVAACYLARAGLDVEVVERDTVLGGAVSTVERWPGYRVDRGSSAHIMVRHTGIVEELDLARFGLEYQDLDPWGFAPFGDVDLTFSVDLDTTCTSIEKACGTRDADAYRAFVLDWSERNKKVFQAFQGPPTAGRLGRTLWGVGASTGLGGVELSRQFLTSADALLDEHFDDERLKTALAWMGAQSGPPGHEPATADL